MTLAPPAVEPDGDQAHDADPGDPIGPGPAADSDPGYRPDPADSVVAIGAVPAIEAPRPAYKKLVTPMPTDRSRGWLVTIVVTAIGALVRFWNLGGATDGGTPLFDEKYYALHAWQVLINGGYEENYAYGVVVHPPLGKQIMALGEWMFGYTPVGWRFSAAVVGTLCIFLMVRVVRRMTRSTLIGGIAGILLICDGMSHVQSRTGLLDIFVAVFVLAAFACVVADRDQVRARLAEFVAAGTIATHPAGPALGARWWRFAAGVLLGCAAAVKWSGLYWIAAFAVLTVIWDITARRDAGIRRSTGAVIRRDLLPSFWALAIVPFLTYVASWWAWFSSENAWARHLTGTTHSDQNGILGKISYSVAKLFGSTPASWMEWQWQMYDFHKNLLTPLDPAKRHPWESKPWSWPIGTRPVLYYAPGGDDATGCAAGVTDCVKRIFLIGTPALWWISLPVLAWALWKIIGRQDWRYAAVVVGYAAGYLPWFLNINRQMYFFYMTPVVPFLVIAISLVLADVLGRPKDGVERKITSLVVVCLYVGLVVVNFIWLWPILNGVPISRSGLDMRIWLPTWG
ncbi:phospholipid carrier-dependent glycosyltransferase [Nakamurella silvestris]|nr:phospholipid carrier-dependent glycosyltransferase [Nakamurella silvestris]